MGFWTQVKSGFAYGMGGTLGWYAANLVVKLLRKLWLVVGVALLGGGLNWYTSTLPPTQPAKQKPVTTAQKKAIPPATAYREYKPLFRESRGGVGAGNQQPDR